MSESIDKGTVSFVNHEKNYILIEYEQNGKKRSVKGSTDEKAMQSGKKHEFHIGDTVSFKVGMSDRGDRMVATGIKFLYNTALEVLINRAQTENNFIGYLKVADGKYFVKEIDSYLFFPLQVSPWQMIPTEKELNVAVTFSLENLDKKDRITAKLYNNSYIPEFYIAVKAHKAKTPIDAEVYKITPHGIYLNLVGEKVRSKLPNKENDTTLKVGDNIKVMITHLGNSRIVVEPVS